MHAAGVAVHAVLWVFMALLWVRFVFDWVQAFARAWTPRGPVLLILETVYSVTDPPVRAVRRVVPPMRLGGTALDLSLLLVLLLTYVALLVNAGLLLDA